MGRLCGKVIVVSGGTKGIGRAACEAFAREGAKVAFGGQDVSAANEVCERIRANGGEAIFVQTDLHHIADCVKLFDGAIQTFGKIDGFFNYAGVIPTCPLDTCDEETFDKIMDVNGKAAFFCCQQAVRYMKENGGSIILTGSTHDQCGERTHAAYAFCGGALQVLCEHISRQYAKEHIRCNYLTVGWTLTEGERALRESKGCDIEAFKKMASNSLPFGRMCEIDDYMEPLIYLMSDASAMVTGTDVKITAGEHI